MTQSTKNDIDELTISSRIEDAMILIDKGKLDQAKLILSMILAELDD